MDLKITSKTAPEGGGTGGGNTTKIPGSATETEAQGDEGGTVVPIETQKITGSGSMSGD